MQPEWYYHRRGQSYGPLSTEELENLVSRHELLPTDTVCVGKGGELLEGGHIIDMFTTAGRSAEPQAASESARKVLSEIVDGRARRNGAENLKSAPFSHSAKTANRVLQSAGLMMETLLSQFAQAFAGFLALRHQKITLVFLLLCAVAYILKDVNFFGPDATTAALNQMMAIADELDLQQGSSASDQNAERFSETARTRLNPLLKDLQQQAARSPRLRSHYYTEAGYRESIARSHLIQAGLVLKEMLNSAGGDVTMRGNFQVRLASARRELGQGNLHSQSDETGTDPLMTSVIVADVVLVVGGGLWWWRRSKQ